VVGKGRFAGEPSTPVRRSQRQIRGATRSGSQYAGLVDEVGARAAPAHPGRSQHGCPRRWTCSIRPIADPITTPQYGTLRARRALVDAPNTDRTIMTPRRRPDGRPRIPSRHDRDHRVSPDGCLEPSEPTYDLSDRHQRIRLYEQVLREALQPTSGASSTLTSRSICGTTSSCLQP
jgi:hypothetical protein